MFDLSWIWTGTNETARGEQLDAALRARNEADYGPGGKFYTAENWDVVQTHLATQEADTANFNSQIGAAAATGAVDGLKSLWQSTKDVLQKPLFKIPLQWWLIAGAALFIWMGGLSWLRGALKKRTP